MGLPAPRILLADDEPAILDVLTPKLRRAGFDVLSATDGKAALEVARRWVPSMIVLDEQMPAMNGLEVCARLAGSVVTAEIPVILLTGLPIQESVPLNIRRIIPKPFSAKTIVEAVQAILATPVASALPQVLG